MSKTDEHAAKTFIVALAQVLADQPDEFVQAFVDDFSREVKSQARAISDESQAIVIRWLNALLRNVGRIDRDSTSPV